MAEREMQPAPAPFWHRLNSFFAFPLQMRPLAYALVLALCSLLYDKLFFLPDMLGFLLVELGILLAASRYAFKVVALGSRGLRRSADFPRALDQDWVHLPWKLFAISMLQGFAIGWLARIDPKLATLAVFVASFTTPAAVIVLVLSGRFFEAVNPFVVWDVMRIVGWPYALLCFFLFLLSTGAQFVLIAVVPQVGAHTALPFVNFVFIYFGWVMASLLGYVMYQHHAALGIDLLPGGGVDGDAPADRRTPAQIEAQRVDAEVAQRIADGDLPGALGLAYEAMRSADADDLAAQRRYHRVLLLVPEKKASLLDHAQRFVALLMRHDLPAEALRVFKACREQDKAFALQDPLQVMALARAGWRGGDAQGVLALLSGFDRRFRGHASIPQAYELAARALVQGLGRADMAQPILAAMESRYPDSEQTQEVRWLLRPAAAD